MATLIFIVLMLSGTFALGLGDVWRKKYLNAGVDEQSLLTVTLFLTGVLLLPIVAIVGFPEIKSGFWLAAGGTVALNLISQNLFIRAFKLSDASLIAPLRLIIPPIVIVTGFIFLGEKPSLLGALGIFITMLGLWFLLFKKEDMTWLRLTAKLKDRGVLYGLIASVLFAVSFPLDKMVVVKSSALFGTFVIFSALGVLTYLVNVIMKKEFNSSLGKVLKENSGALFLISIAFSAGVFLTNQALNYSLAAYASSLKRLQALWTILLAGSLLKEKEIRRRVFAAAVMFAGILLSVLVK
ncbi:MAG: DMT family transporter [Patescibacteria group bacterium]